jgi:imidazole glycerol-phosphate synthase subunit HisF
MLQVRVIPALLLKGQGLVKTVQFKNEKYIGDPINAIKIFNDKEVDELVFLDITASKENREPNYALIHQIAGECFMPLSYGGGITTIEQIRKILSLGVEKVIVNTHAANNPNFIKEASNLFGNSTIVVSIDVKKNFLGKNKVYICDGSINTKKDPIDYAQSMEQAGAGELLLNSIDRDGTMQGYDLDLIKKIVDAVSIPVVCCGGAGNLNHLKQVASSTNVSGLSAGSIFVYQGPHKAVLITYPDYTTLKQLLEK